MQRDPLMTTPRIARILLALVVIYGLARLADPHERWAALMMRGDRIEHASVAYLATLFSLAAFPRLPIWAPAIALTVFGIAVEAVQALPFIVGDAQGGDIVANSSGAILATFPVWLMRRRGAA
jgi:hypothetical protein